MLIKTACNRRIPRHREECDADFAIFSSIFLFRRFREDLILVCHSFRALERSECVKDGLEAVLIFWSIL